MPNEHRQDRDVADAYDRWSSTYDSDTNATRDLDATVLRRASLTLTGKRVLEFGCGTGKNTVWLASVAESVTALDFSAGMLARAGERVSAPNVRFLEHDIRERFPIDDGTVDTVIGNLVLEHVADVARVFGEAARVLTTRGQLYVCELHPYRQLRGGQAHFDDVTTGETVAVPAHRHSTSEYVNAAIAAGFTLDALGEWTDAGATREALPRLLSILCHRRQATDHPPDTR
jgi:Methylase involved in ubiquinone/menaquinone biosynthesis